MNNLVCEPRQTVHSHQAYVDKVRGPFLSWCGKVIFTTFEKEHRLRVDKLVQCRKWESADKINDPKLNVLMTRLTGAKDINACTHLTTHNYHKYTSKSGTVDTVRHPSKMITTQQEKKACTPHEYLQATKSKTARTSHHCRHWQHYITSTDPSISTSSSQKTTIPAASMDN